MSGHSKWATTKHKKAAVDARRGKLFAKLIKNVEVAARTGGSDPAGNPTLYDAVQKAKKSSVPNENIDRAIRRGSGAEGGGAAYEAITYEGYAPGGVAVLVECLTDNRNRAAADVRTALTRNGGSMADPGSVSYLFARKGVVIVSKAGGVTEDDVLAAVLDAGAEEVNDLGESFEVVSEATDLVAVRTAVEQAGLDYESAAAGRPATRRGKSPPRAPAAGRFKTTEHVYVSDPGMVSRMRVLGVDPGLTRCGVGVIDGMPGRALTLVATDVIRTPPGDDIAGRLLALEAELDRWLTEHRPDAVAVERVFSQHNVRT